MFKQFLLTAGLLITTMSISAETTEQPTPNNDTIQTGYIIDDLYTYMHAGAGKNFRIIGSINAGSPLELITEQDGYTQVKDDKGRTGWVDQRFVTKKSGLTIENQLLKDKVAELENNLQLQSEQLPDLQQQNSMLNDEIAQLIKKLSIAKQQSTQQTAIVANNTEKEKQELLMYGAAIGFTGLLFGIIITLVLSRRKRYDGWA